MSNRSALVAYCIVVALALALAACGASPKTRFYTLHPVGERGAERSAAPATNLSVYVKPVEIPDYLDRPQIVTRSGENELRLAEYDRWAGSLADDITAVVAEELSRLLGTDQVYSYRAMQGEKADYTVALRILRLDCTPGDRVFLRAQWLVRCPGGAGNLATRAGTFTAAVKDNSYQTVVEAVSKVLEQVSAAIAREIPREQPSWARPGAAKPESLK